MSQALGWALYVPYFIELLQEFFEMDPLFMY